MNVGMVSGTAVCNFRVIMMTSLLPSILVPLIGLVFPAVAMASLFLYIEQDQIS